MSKMLFETCRPKEENHSHLTAWYCIIESFEYLENVPHIKNSGYDMVKYFFIA